MRVLLSTWGSRGDVEPMAALAVRLRELGAEVRVCAPPDFAELLARVGVPLVPVGRSVRALVHGLKPPSPDAASGSRPSWSPRSSTRSPRRPRDVTRWWRPADAGRERAMAEKLGIRYVFATFHLQVCRRRTRRRRGRAGRPTGRDRQPGAVGRGRRAGQRAVRPAAQHPPGVDRPATGGQRPRLRLHRPPVAGGGPDPGPVAGVGGPRRRADRRVDPAGRTPAPGRVGGVPGRRHTTGVRGLRQHGLRAPEDAARVAIEAIRAQGRRARLPAAGPTWP